MSREKKVPISNWWDPASRSAALVLIGLEMEKCARRGATTPKRVSGWAARIIRIVRDAPENLERDRRLILKGLPTKPMAASS